jgi:rod shape-determining protein MreC
VRFIRRFRFPLLVAVFLLAALSLFSLHAGRPHQTSSVGRYFLELAGPLQQIVTQAGNAIDGLWRRYFLLVHAARQNQELKKEVAALRQERVHLREMARANQRLRDLLGLKERLNYPLVAAEVVGSDPTFHFRTAIVNKGSLRGVTTQMPVIHPQGVVGKIIWVSPHYAKVLLLTDPNSGVDVIIQRSRARGVVEGAGKDTLRLKYVQHNYDVAPGDPVITSGAGGVFPRGLLVGTVQTVKQESKGVFQTVEVNPAVDFERLEEVLIVLQRREFVD